MKNSNDPPKKRKLPKKICILEYEEATIITAPVSDKNFKKLQKKLIFLTPKKNG